MCGISKCTTNQIFIYISLLIRLSVWGTKIIPGQSKPSILMDYCILITLILNYYYYYYYVKSKRNRKQILWVYYQVCRSMILFIFPFQSPYEVHLLAARVCTSLHEVLVSNFMKNTYYYLNNTDPFQEM